MTLNTKGKTKDFSKQQLESEEQVEDLINSLETMQPSPENFVWIKQIIQKHGFPILFFLESFWKKIQSSGDLEYKNSFKQITTYALGFMPECSLPQLNFILNYSGKKNKNTIDKTSANLISDELCFKKLESEKLSFYQFGQILQNVSQKKKMIKNNQLKSQKFNKFIQKIQRSHSVSILMQKVIRKVAELNQTRKLERKFFSSSEQEQQDYYSQIKNTQQFADIHDEVRKGQNGEIQNFELNDRKLVRNQEKVNSHFQYDQSFFSEKNNRSINSVLDLNFSSDIQLSQYTNILHGQELRKPICCRTYFLENEILSIRTGIRTQLMKSLNISQKSAAQQMKKVCCSFINTQGGNIIIGTQPVGIVNKIQTCIYTEDEKQRIQKFFTRIFDSIEPDVLTDKISKVQFVPIKKESRTQKYIQGGFVIRVSLKFGKRNEIYSYREGQDDYFPYRTQEGRINFWKGRKIIEQHAKILKIPLPQPKPIHFGECDKPQIGVLFYSKNNLTNKEKAKCQIPIYSAMNISDLTKYANNSQLFTQQQKGATLEEVKDIAEQKQVNEEKKKEQKKQNQQTKQSIQISNNMDSLSQKKKNQNEQVYFFCQGLQEKKLRPFLAKHNLEQLQLENYSSKKIIIKLMIEVYSQAFILFRKIEKKYPKITFTQISRRVNILANIEKILEIIKPINLKYRYESKNIIKFDKILESFQFYVIVSEKYRNCFQYLHA